MALPLSPPLPRSLVFPPPTPPAAASGPTPGSAGSAAGAASAAESLRALIESKAGALTAATDARVHAVALRLRRVLPARPAGRGGPRPWEGPPCRRPAA